MKLTAVQIEDSARFRIGDIVMIASTQDWAADWLDVTAEVIGICWDRRAGEFNVTLREAGDLITDGFRIDDLALVPAGRASLEAS